MPRAVTIGEELAGAWLSLCEGCDFVTYSQRHPTGQGEIDVLALKMTEKRAYLCQVTTHLGGMLYSTGPKPSSATGPGSSYYQTVAKVRDKWNRDIRYVEECLDGFETELMLWTLKASKEHVVGPLTALATKLMKKHPLTISIIANAEYARRIRQLEAKAKRTTKETGNSAFRVLQILARLAPVEEREATAANRKRRITQNQEHA
ncbi:MAG: hypothetical protein IID41_11805 [Planctomycetes bacterium]|nr:hypothetical protein [Planctomycetota bacterium]